MKRARQCLRLPVPDARQAIDERAELGQLIGIACAEDRCWPAQWVQYLRMCRTPSSQRLHTKK